MPAPIFSGIYSPEVIIVSKKNLAGKIVLKWNFSGVQWKVNINQNEWQLQGVKHVLWEQKFKLLNAVAQLFLNDA